MLAPYVPRLALDLGAAGSPSWTSVEGSMLSADISGFTALSERLAGKGKAGAEEITQLINACFSALIDAAYAYGGEVVKFGGDALLIVFRGDRHQRRAADAGLSMQRALSASAAAKRANLSMTVGVADGPFDAFVVGSGYRELIITGRRASEVIRLEAAATQGQTLVSDSIAECVPESMRGERHDGGIVLSGSTGDLPSGAHVRDVGDSDLTPYVPSAVADQLAGFATLGGEHRLVTVGFVMIAGIAAEIEQAGANVAARTLQHVIDRVVETCDAYGVTLLHSDIAPDGVKLVLCAGAPVSQGDTSEAMLRTALAIAGIESPLVIRQGIQTGRVFAGFLGAEHRRTYTLMGDPVNTAARMIGKADDRDVVAVATVIASTRAMFRTEQLQPFLVKGKTQPIIAHKVYELLTGVHREGGASRLVGRAAEVASLSAAVAEGGVAFELVGGVGVGKSRLIDTLNDVTIPIFRGTCTPYGAGVPYGVFRPLLRSGMGIADDMDAEATGIRLTGVITRVAPDLVPMLPLLAVPFGASVASTADVDAIDPNFRRARMRDVVVAFLDVTVNSRAALIVEDAQWIDEASGELLDHLVRACASRPWTVVVTRRPDGPWRLDTELAHARSVPVEPLSDDDIRQLVVDNSAAALTDHDIDVFAARAQGNPLFAVELARSLSGATSDLPDTVEQIIATRFDTLAPPVRHWMRLASVLGTQFDAEIVRSMIDASGTVVDSDAALADAEAAEAVSPLSGSTWAFNHTLYRDTVYEGLPYSLRRRLHLHAATILEQRSTEIAEAAPMLSLHYAAAKQFHPAWRYSLIAAETAESQHATGDASLAYERALLAGARCRDITNAERAAVAQKVGDLSYGLARFDRAAGAYATARRINNDPIVETGLMRRIGSVGERQGRPDRALRWYRRAAQSIPPDATDADWTLARAEVELAEAGIRHRLGDNEGCLRAALSARDHARDLAELRIEALALERVHLALTYLRRPDVEHAGLAALAAHRRLDDYSGIARTLINLGIEAYFAGDLTDASERYLEALTTAQRSGDVVLAATAALNGAEILSDRGDWERAIDLFDNARRNYEAVGYGAGVAASGYFAGIAALRASDIEGARSRFEAARPRLDQLGMGEMVDELDAYRFELDVFSGAATVEDGDALLQRLGLDHACSVRVQRTAALLSRRLGDEHGGRRALLALLAQQRQPGQPGGIELAQTLIACASVAADESAEAESWRREAAAILVTLGVVTAPPLPI